MFEANKENTLLKPEVAKLLEMARENFNSWNKALLSGKPEEVAALYSSEATFLPTLNPKFKTGQEEAEEYFEHFLKKNPEGKIVEDAVQITAYDKDGSVSGFLHSGMYDFLIGPEDKRETAKARFTFLWQKDENGEWKISHHHSSLVPQG